MDYILHLDDDPEDVLLFRNAMLQFNPGLKYLNIDLPHQGLEFLDTTLNLPCFIILDLNMPGMNGMDLLIAIKSNPRLRKVPIGILTTSSLISDSEFCKKHCDFYFLKPFEFSGYESIVTSMMDFCRPSHLYKGRKIEQ